MFGFSLTKLLVTIAAIVLIWYGFKVIGRHDRARKARLKQERTAARRGTGETGAPMRQADDMVKCPACGTYVSATGASACGREDCPYPG
ncbi:MAG: hypothetical protein ACE5LL_08170 [Alphaproteobacteria bacterium]